MAERKETKEQKRARIAEKKKRLEARIADVEAAMVLGLRSREIESSLSKAHGVSERMIRKDMEKIRMQWADEAMKDDKREYRIHALEKRVESFYRKCLADKAHGAAARALVLQADMLGARQMKVEHTGKVEHGIKDMTSDDKRKRLSELMKVAKERKAARESGKPN